DADQDDGEPVDAWYVLPRPELGNKNRQQQRAHRVRGVGEAEAERLVEVVGRGLPNRGAKNLDDPEVDGDFGDLVQHLPRDRSVRPGAEGRRYRAHVEFLLPWVERGIVGAGI